MSIKDDPLMAVERLKQIGADHEADLVCDLINKSERRRLEVKRLREKMGRIDEISAAAMKREDLGIVDP